MIYTYTCAWSRASVQMCMSATGVCVLVFMPACIYACFLAVTNNNFLSLILSKTREWRPKQKREEKKRENKKIKNPARLSNNQQREAEASKAGTITAKGNLSRFIWNGNHNCEISAFEEAKTLETPQQVAALKIHNLTQTTSFHTDRHRSFGGLG